MLQAKYQEDLCADSCPLVLIKSSRRMAAHGQPNDPSRSGKTVGDVCVLFASSLMKCSFGRLGSGAGEHVTRPAIREN